MDTMHGLTDGPPHTLPALALVRQWLIQTQHRLHQQERYEMSDGSDVIHYGTIDLDYEMAYLLLVGAPDGESYDWLMAYVRHTGMEPGQVEVEWLQEPKGFFEHDLDSIEKAMVRFSTGTLARRRRD